MITPAWFTWFRRDRPVARTCRAQLILLQPALLALSNPYKCNLLSTWRNFAERMGQASRSAERAPCPVETRNIIELIEKARRHGRHRIGECVSVSSAIIAPSCYRIEG